MATTEWQEQWKPPNPLTSNGFTKAAYLSEEQISQILELVSSGVPKHQACREAGTSNTQLTRRCVLDAEVNVRVSEAMAEGKPSFLEHLRAEQYFQAFIARNYKAVRDLSLIHDPDWAPLHTQRFEIGNIDGEAFRMAAIKELGPISDDDLRTLIEIFERQQVALTEGK